MQTAMAFARKRTFSCSVTKFDCCVSGCQMALFRLTAPENFQRNGNIELKLIYYTPDVANKFLAVFFSFNSHFMRIRKIGKKSVLLSITYINIHMYMQRFHFLFLSAKLSVPLAIYLLFGNNNCEVSAVRCLHILT